MRILRLTLENFKGAKYLDVDFDGDNVDVYGDNGTYKTTLKDAYLWLLFSKDSQGRADFALKTLDEAGVAHSNLTHTVEALILVDGQNVTIRKTLSEKWTKKRGSAMETLTGHTTDYYINGVPVKQGEYVKRIASLADEDMFAILSDPTRFNNLHWQTRRDILLEVCGGLTDEEVIASDKSLKQIPAILQGRAMEDHRKVIAARRSKINEELKAIPIRIDEATRALPDIELIGAESVTAQLNALKAEHRTMQEKIVQAESGGEIAAKKLKLAEVEAEIIGIQNRLTTERSQLVAGQREILEEYADVLDTYRREFNALTKSTGELAIANAKLDDQIKALRDEWLRVHSIDSGSDAVCPTCGQTLPAEKVASTKAAFNLHKSEQLAAIQAEGKALSEKLAEQQELLIQREDKLSDLPEEIETAEERVNVLAAEIRETEHMPLESDSLTQAREGKALLEQSIKELIAGSVDSAREYRATLARLEMHIQAAEDALRKVAAHQAGQLRISELKRQEEALAAEFEKLEGELYLCESFIRRKVALLEERINSKFRYARFKLFEQQINGGIVETCETTYNGVPYSKGLNNGHRGIVGLDIIATLADHYNFYPPIFYDNAESVTVLPEMKSQLIALYVSEKDKTLRIVRKNEKLREVS